MEPLTSSGTQSENTSPWEHLAWLPIPVLLAAIVAARIAGLPAAYESKTLMLALDFFYSLVSLGTLYVIGRAFLSIGSPGLLLLGCGILLWSLSGTVGDLVSHGDHNINVTIFNTSIMLMGMCHLAGAILATRPQRVIINKMTWLGIGFALTLGSIWLICQAALSGWLPVFFIPGYGGTLVRHFVLISAISMLVLSAGLLHNIQRKTRLPFTYWYSLALLLLAVGLFGIMIQLSLGSILNWLSRTAQWLGGIYLFIAALASLRESHLPLLARENKPHPAYYPYAVAVAVVLTATAIRLAFLAEIGMQAPYLIFYPAVAFAAIYGGLRAGLLATALSAFLAVYFWSEPVIEKIIDQPSSWMVIIIFMISGTIISWTADSMIKARDSAAAAETKLQLAAEREAAAEALRQSEERFRSYFELGLIGMAISSPDKGMIEVNDEVCKILGYDRDELLQMNWEELTHIDDRAADISLFNRTMSGEINSYSLEKRFVRKNGQIVYAVISVKCIRKPVGSPDYYVVLLQDISERKQTEAFLKADLSALTSMHRLSRKHLEAEGPEPLLQEIMDTAVAIMGAERGTLQLKKGDSLIIAANHGHDRPFLEFFASAGNVASVCGEATKRMERIIIENVESSPLFAGTESLSVLRAAGVRAVQSTPLISHDGKLLGILTTHWGRPHIPDEHDLWRIDMLVRLASDLIMNKNAEDALKKLNEELEERVAERTAELQERDRLLLIQSRHAAMGEMIGNIAHQWRQPLNFLGMQLQQLRLFYDLGHFNGELLHHNVAGSMQLIQHMSRTIDDFRNYFKPDKEKEEFSIRESINKTLSLLEGSLKNPPIDIEVIVKDDPVINGYQNEFSQVIFNIIINARDIFIEREISSPKIIITVFSAEGRTVVTVADNAGGIPEDIISMVFDPYFTTKGPQQGTGVGLFMSKSIIEKNMGGQLCVRNIDDGAEFRIEVSSGNSN